jgi:hypothetical protein
VTHTFETFLFMSNFVDYCVLLNKCNEKEEMEVY